MKELRQLKPGGPVYADDFNALVREVERLSRLHVDGPAGVQLEQGAGGPQLIIPAPFFGIWAIIDNPNDADHPWAWREMRPIQGGRFEVKLPGRSGTVNFDPLYNPSGEKLADGTVVFITKGAAVADGSFVQQEWLVLGGCCGGCGCDECTACSETYGCLPEEIGIYVVFGAYGPQYYAGITYKWNGSGRWVYDNCFSSPNAPIFPGDMSIYTNSWLQHWEVDPVFNFYRDIFALTPDGNMPGSLLTFVPFQSSFGMPQWCWIDPNTMTTKYRSQQAGLGNGTYNFERAYLYFKTTSPLKPCTVAPPPPPPQPPVFPPIQPPVQPPVVNPGGAIDPVPIGGGTSGGTFAGSAQSGTIQALIPIGPAIPGSPLPGAGFIGSAGGIDPALPPLNPGGGFIGSAGGIDPSLPPLTPGGGFSTPPIGPVTPGGGIDPSLPPISPVIPIAVISGGGIDPASGGISPVIPIAVISGGSIDPGGSPTIIGGGGIDPAAGGGFVIGGGGLPPITPVIVVPGGASEPVGGSIDPSLPPITPVIIPPSGPSGGTFVLVNPGGSGGGTGGGGGPVIPIAVNDTTSGGST